jgi:hypothetical protein
MEGRDKLTGIPMEQIEEILPTTFRLEHSGAICPSRAQFSL